MLARALVTLALALALWLAPASARADWFPSEPIDGPSADIVALGGADLARDGRGALVYLKREGGVAHVFLSRLVDGVWRAPERVDGGVELPATEAAVAVADERRVAIAWIAGGRLFGALVSGGGTEALGGVIELAPDARDLALDMGINGTAYATYTATSGAGGGDVRAVRLQGATWEAVPAPLDIDPARPAGVGTARARVAVSAEGNAVATWGEAGEVYGRRLTGLVGSVAPQELSLADLSGAPGGAADSPELDIEDDGSYAWALWRQDFGGASRVVARRLVGSQWEAPAVVDAGAGSVSGRIELTGRGVGAAVSANPSGSAVAVLADDAFTVPFSLLGGTTAPAVALAEREQTAGIAVQGGVLLGRYAVEQGRFGPAAVLSRPELGAVEPGAYDIAGDRIGDFAVGMVQGPPEARRITGAVYDRPPAPPVPSTSANFQNRSQPRLRWGIGLDLWGPQTFTVLVDGQPVGTTSERELVPAQPLAEGAHRWRVVATDRRGQAVRGRERVVRIDTRAPLVRVSVRGARRSGRALRVDARASDRGGSGVASVRVDYGDGTRSERARSVHRYRRGRWALQVRVADRAGNVTRQRLALRIR